jgi:hypothetical protein
MLYTNQTWHLQVYDPFLIDVLEDHYLVLVTGNPVLLQSKNNSQVEYVQRILTSIVAYAIIVYRYIRNLSNNFSSCCESSDIYVEK